MQGSTTNPEQARNKKRQGSPRPNRQRASKIKAKQHPAPAPPPVKSAVPTDESTVSSSDDDIPEDLATNATPSVVLSERMPRPEMADTAWMGKTFPLVDVRSPGHGDDKTIVYSVKLDRVVGLYPFRRKTKNPRCFMAYVSVDRTDLKQGRKVRIHPGQTCTLVGTSERRFGISSIIMIADNPPRQVNSRTSLYIPSKNVYL